MSQNDKIANDFAIDYSFAGAKYLGEWNGFSCYRPKSLPQYETGYMSPDIILVKDNIARWTSQEELTECPY